VYFKLSTSKDFSDQVGTRVGLTSILKVDAYKSQTKLGKVKLSSYKSEIGKIFG
jgi:hypothetical protein